MFRMSSVTVHVLFVKLFLKLWTASLILPAENLAHQCDLIQKLFWASDKGFKIASCVTLQT